MSAKLGAAAADVSCAAAHFAAAEPPPLPNAPACSPAAPQANHHPAMPKSALIAALLLALATGGWAQDPIAPTPAPAPAPASPASASPAQAPAPAPAPFVWEPWMKPRVDADSNKGLRPQRLQAYNRTHYFQLLPAEDAVGTVVFLHGCARQARAFFPFDPKHCKECVGKQEGGGTGDMSCRLWRVGCWGAIGLPPRRPAGARCQFVRDTVHRSPCCVYVHKRHRSSPYIAACVLG